MEDCIIVPNDPWCFLSANSTPTSVSMWLRCCPALFYPPEVRFGSLTCSLHAETSWDIAYFFSCLVTNQGKGWSFNQSLRIEGKVLQNSSWPATIVWCAWKTNFIVVVTLACYLSIKCRRGTNTPILFTQQLMLLHVALAQGLAKEGPHTDLFSTGFCAVLFFFSLYILKY